MKIKPYIFSIALGTALLINALTASATADKHHHAEQHRSKYAGEETRRIKSLSKNDIEQLSQGRGWGLAKAAELNGMPGPIHLLEMKDEIKLTPRQISKIETLFNHMQQQAVHLGKKLIELEDELNTAFANKTISKKPLQQLLNKIAATRSELRYVHLAAHLETPNILTASQVTQYNQLRGYHLTSGDDDPCNNIPSGHDPIMWKQHNGCN